MPKVTIVIPVLNVEPYIRECLDSVVNQTITDIEIFCIDAGSTDGTLEIEQEYAAKDSRITILDDIARSTGYSKNIGFKLAKSKYVAIVESDDYIALDMIEKLYNIAEKFDLDMVKGNYRTFLGDGDSRLFVDKSISLDGNDYDRVIDPRTDNRYFCWDMYTWTGLYKKEFLDAYHIAHNESKGAAFQDVGFWFQTFCYAKRVYLTRDYFYHYRRDNPNASVNNPNRTFVMCDEYRFLKDVLLRDEPTWKRVLPAYYHELFRSYFVTYERLASHLKSDFAQRFYDDISEGFECGEIKKELFEEYELAYLDALRESKDIFEAKLKEQKESIEKKRMELYERIKEHPYVIIFSAGSHGSNLQIMLKQCFDIDVTAFCDNDGRKHHTFINSVEVISLEQAIAQYPEALYIVANKRYEKKIVMQLEDKGVVSEKICQCKVEEVIDAFL